jgi:phospholipase/carboxylesterase
MTTRLYFLSTATALGIFAALPREFLRLPAGTKLAARPRKPTKTLQPGLHRLGLRAGERDALCYLPQSFDPKAASPLLVGLHGATQDAQFMDSQLRSVADALRCPALSPDSRDVSWDGIRGEFNHDVVFIDKCLDWVFDRVGVDPRRVWRSGFSDGASYGLTLALANGDLFSRVRESSSRTERTTASCRSSAAAV